ncbi:hypothetical protein NIES37_28320 [Tolypothrix tenuis PCC 7101]|uniref:Uncharacterized protein n=1 Tax=Tolypothrix tenuis PCC 7101 TaxID=231146 RepID=A0A1Z4MZF6_9CYAN|nr:hypothetical protein NIES37_28320 [Tolypothrix tenuis PCC 7101]BAZ77227.1 hypothetical protein NIES50_58300 [Aulosira laxa NIES-50]
MMEIDVASGSLCLSVVIVWMRVMGKLKKRLVPQGGIQNSKFKIQN